MKYGFLKKTSYTTNLTLFTHHLEITWLSEQMTSILSRTSDQTLCFTHSTEKNETLVDLWRTPGLSTFRGSVIQSKATGMCKMQLQDLWSLWKLIILLCRTGQYSTLFSQYLFKMFYGKCLTLNPRPLVSFNGNQITFSSGKFLTNRTAMRAGHSGV